MGFGRMTFQKYRNKTAAQWTMALTICIPAMTGCGKKDTEMAPAPSTAPTGKVDFTSQAVPATPPPSEPSSPSIGSSVPTAPAGLKDDQGRDLGQQELQYALGRFTENNERPPRDLKELVTSGLMPAIPNAPAGKKYDLNPAKTEVVIVPK